MHLRLILSTCCSLLLASCLSQTPPPTVRWFLPEVGPFELDASNPDQPLRALTVTTRSHLREPMVWRLSEVEIFFDAQERWGTEPLEIVRSELEEALFDQGPFIRSESRTAPNLVIKLRAFEGVYGKVPVAACEILAVHDDGKLIRQRTFLAETPLNSTRADDLARALGRALQQVAVDLREWVKTSG